MDERILRKLDAFSLAMREHARGGAGGVRRSKALGSSVEFSDFRSYAPGDDLRRVDWNAYARFDKLFLKLFLDEQETTLHLLVDASGSMPYGEPDKWSLTRDLAAILAYLSLSRYDRVVILALKGDTVQKSRKFSGRQAFPEVEKYLASIEPGGKTRLDDALPKAPLSPGRGICVLLSDLLTDAGYEKGIKSLLYRKQEVALLQVMSPQELEPDYTGALQFIDAEGEPDCQVVISPDTLKRYHQALTEFLTERKAFCYRHALPHLLVPSDMDLEREVLRALMESGVIAART